MNKSIRIKHLQSGAALVVGMLLLLVITLLAISSMNSASLELMMAGNEQFHQRAFQAAQAGIEQGVRVTPLETAAATPSVSGALGADTYSYVVTPMFGGQPTNPPKGSGNSQDSGVGGGAGAQISANYFEVSSTGNAPRSAVESQIQGFYQMERSSDTTGYDKNPCEGDSSLQMDRSGCGT